MFGEIGIVCDTARTASVDCITDSTLLEIPGDDFLEAVTGSGALPDPLRRTISLRLGPTHPSLDTARP